MLERTVILFSEAVFSKRAKHLLMLSTLAAWTIVSNAAACSETAIAPFERIAEAIERHFAGLDYHEPGDLISRADVQDALDYVAELGWQPANRVALEKLILPENAFLVSKLRTEEGTEFMRKAAELKGAYDRLDRLSALSGGRKAIDTLIRKKGDHELIEYLRTSKVGKNLGSLLTRAEGGSNLNKPTGRIYTVDGLIDELSRAYEEQAQPRQ